MARTSCAAQPERKPKWRPFSMETATHSDSFNSRAIDMSKNIDIDGGTKTCETERFELSEC